MLVFKLSRFARNTSDTAKYLQELASYGIGLLGVKDGIDTSTVTGKMIANIMGAVAEVELENIHEQTLAGRQQKARNGLWNGAQAPFGYALEDKRLIICPDEAEIVKEIYRLYTEERQSISYISKKINDENIRREQRGNVKIPGFTDRTVRIILSNPVYAGMISYGRRHTVKVEGTNNETKVVKQDDESKIILVDGLHEAIISKETFAKAEERLKKNVAHRKTRSDSTTVYPLTGLIKCPDCGKNIFGYTAPPRKKKNGKEGYYPRYISYRCISGRDRNGITCSLANKYYSGTKLETEVREVISSMVTIPEFMENISQKIDVQTDVKALRKKQTAIRNEITKYNGNLIQTEKRLTELDAADKHYEKKVDSLNRILDELYEKIEDAQTRLDEVNQEIAMVEKSAMTKQSIFEMLEGFSKYYRRWATVENLKRMAKTKLYMDEHSLDYASLTDWKSVLTKQEKELSEKINQAQMRLAEINVLKTHIVNYSKTKDIYVAYRKSGYSKKFLEEHESDIIIHKAAKKAFDELGVKKLPTIKSLQVEFADLLSTKKTAYADLKRIRDELRELSVHKANYEELRDLEEREERKEKERGRE